MFWIDLVKNENTKTQASQPREKIEILGFEVGEAFYLWL